MASDIVTLENLASKFPLWSPQDENHLYAIVDMGSNGIRFSIISLAPPTPRLLKPVFSSRAAISLFDALGDHGLDAPGFSGETIAQVSATLSRFQHQATTHGVAPEHVIVLATEAMRRASNASAMMAAIAEAAGGMRVHILDPPVETLLGAVMGSRSGVINVTEGALFLDLGGGSVQMTWVDTSMDDYEIEAAKAGKSLPYGAAKLQRILDAAPASGTSEQVLASETSNLSQGIRSAYDALCARFPRLAAIKAAYAAGDQDHGLLNVYMCGGGFRGYGSMLMHDDPVQPYPFPFVDGYSASGARFKQYERMSAINADFEGKIMGLSARRRKQFPAITSVIRAVVEAVPNIRRVTFCGGSNKEGIMMMKLPLSVRESNPLDALAMVSDAEAPLFLEVLKILRGAVPAELDFSQIPSIFSTGLGNLFVREMWSRQGYSAEQNSSYALHNALIRDTDCPGLTHLCRAILAIAEFGRWGGKLSSIDANLFQSLRGIADQEHSDAAFWALFIGAVSGLMTAVFPLFPHDVNILQKTISFKSRITSEQGKKKKIVELTIVASSSSLEGIILDDIVSKIKNASEIKGGQKLSWKLAIKVEER